jgi:hypothetical protein
MALTRAQVSYENSKYRWENELNDRYTAEDVKKRKIKSRTGQKKSTKQSRNEERKQKKNCKKWKESKTKEG